VTETVSELKMPESRETPVEGGQGDRYRYGLTSVQFIFINLLIVCWFGLTAVHVSPPGKLQNKLEDLFLPMTRMIHFNQHWSMFSPTVRNFNEYGESFISFADGSIKLYEWYRLSEQNQFTRWQHGKSRELWTDQMLDENLMYGLYPSVARYMARANLFPGNEPQRVSLSANWHRIPSYFTRYNDLPQEYEHYTFAVYKVRPEDLK
jgi:hypothetical protein